MWKRRKELTEVIYPLRAFPSTTWSLATQVGRWEQCLVWNRLCHSYTQKRGREIRGKWIQWDLVWTYRGSVCSILSKSFSSFSTMSMQLLFNLGLSLSMGSHYKRERGKSVRILTWHWYIINIIIQSINWVLSSRLYLYTQASFLILSKVMSMHKPLQYAWCH